MGELTVGRRVVQREHNSGWHFQSKLVSLMVAFHVATGKKKVMALRFHTDHPIHRHRLSFSVAVTPKLQHASKLPVRYVRPDG